MPDTHSWQAASEIEYWCDVSTKTYCQAWQLVLMKVEQEK